MALACSIITSFDTYGITREQREAYAAFDKALHDAGRSDLTPIPIELYVAMEPDLLQLHRRLGLNRRHQRPLTVTDVFSQVTPVQLYDSAMMIAESVKSSCGTRPIIGLATFLPEIARLPVQSEDAANVSVQALSNILVLGQILRTEFGYPVHQVEAVCGSRFSGGMMKSQERDIQLTVTLDRDVDAESRMMKRLRLAFDKARKISRSPEQLPCLALELEPGPYFVLRDQATLERIAKGFPLPGNNEFRIGFNVDLAHWRIAKIDSLVTECELMTTHIVHAHLSGHHPRAHFGDCVPTEDDWAAYKPLLQFLSDKLCGNDVQKARNEHSLPQFSGFVSVEYEAAMRVRDVANVVSDLARRLPR